MVSFIAASSAMLLVACGGGTRNAAVVELMFISADGRTLTVGIDSCNAEPVLTVVEQQADRVVLTAESEQTAGGDCADGGVVTLREPLGDRRLVDDLTGRDVIADNVQVLDE